MIQRKRQASFVSFSEEAEDSVFDRVFVFGRFVISFRQVSLGGKSRTKTQESKQEFLERTRKEREDREQARRREKAASSIQVAEMSLLIGLDEFSFVRPWC